MQCSLLESKPQPHEPGGSASHRDASPKGKGRNTAVWAVTASPRPDVFWIQHRKLPGNTRALHTPVYLPPTPLQSLHGLCTHRGGHAAIAIVVTASGRIIRALSSPAFTRVSRCTHVIATALNNLSWPNKNRLGICLCFDLHQDKSAVPPQWFLTGKRKVR